MRVLFDMEISSTAKVTKISADDVPDKHKYGVGEIEARLLEMGFIEGCTVTIMHKGLFGREPIAVRIDNHNSLIALRKNEALSIYVI